LWYLVLFCPLIPPSLKPESSTFFGYLLETHDNTYNPTVTFPCGPLLPSDSSVFVHLSSPNQAPFLVTYLKHTIILPVPWSRSLVELIPPLSPYRCVHIFKPKIQASALRAYVTVLRICFPACGLLALFLKIFGSRQLKRVLAIRLLSQDLPLLNPSWIFVAIYAPCLHSPFNP
jgi:hypothetical protein